MSYYTDTKNVAKGMEMKPSDYRYTISGNFFSFARDFVFLSYKKIYMAKKTNSKPKPKPSDYYYTLSKGTRPINRPK